MSANSWLFTYSAATLSFIQNLAPECKSNIYPSFRSDLDFYQFLRKMCDSSAAAKCCTPLPQWVSVWLMYDKKCIPNSKMVSIILKRMYSPSTKIVSFASWHGYACVLSLWQCCSHIKITFLGSGRVLQVWNLHCTKIQEKKGVSIDLVVQTAYVVFCWGFFYHRGFLFFCCSTVLGQIGRKAEWPEPHPSFSLTPLYDCVLHVERWPVRTDKFVWMSNYGGCGKVTNFTSLDSGF